MKKKYQATKVKAVKVRQAQIICASVKGTFGVSKESKEVEAGEESDWSSTNLNW